MSDVVVIDYGIGNVFSVCNALKQVGATPLLTRERSSIRSARRVILPGVGAFSRAMENLRALGLDEEVASYAATGRPFLGICIGMQALMDVSSEFGVHAGLGLIRGTVDRIPAATTQGTPLRVPHVCWSEVVPARSSPSRNWPGSAFDQPRHYYFVHSYMARPADPADVLAIASYGGNPITAAIRHGNIIGVQFHPERSGPAGLRFLREFVEANTGTAAIGG